MPTWPCFFSSFSVDYNSYEESHTLYFNEIVLQAAKIFMPNDVKTWPDGYFTYVLTYFSVKFSVV